MTARKRHIPRPVVPWRAMHLTVCGRDLEGCEQVTRQEVAAAFAAVTLPPGAGWEAAAKLKIGVLARIRVCRVCSDEASWFRPWDVDPVGVLRTEADRPVNWFYGNGTIPKKQSLLELELRAIADLIEVHRGEYGDLLERYEVMAALTAPLSRVVRR